MLRTGNEYKESLDDGRVVYMDGERVDKVSTHPAFKPLVDIRARMFDMPHTEEHRDLLSYTYDCLLYTSPSPRDRTRSRMPSSA